MYIIISITLCSYRSIVDNVLPISYMKILDKIAIYTLRIWNHFKFPPSFLNFGYVPITLHSL